MTQMNGILNRNRYENHLRKLSEIRQNRIKVIAINNTSNRKANPKGEYIKLRRLTNIQVENLTLAEKCKEVYSRKSRFPVNIWDSHSMNKKTRQDFDEKVKTQNKSIMDRILRQKSQYSFSSNRRPYSVGRSNASLRKRSLQQIKPQQSSQTTKYLHQYQLLPKLVDDFSRRTVVYSQNVRIFKRISRVELSKSVKFDYLLLDFMSLGVKYKLRLSKETGQRMFGLFEKEKQGFFEKRINIEKGEPMLLLAFPPFVRKYKMIKVLAGLKRRSKSVSEGNLEADNGLFSKELIKFKSELYNVNENGGIEQQEDGYYEVFDRQDSKQKHSVDQLA